MKSLTRCLLLVAAIPERLLCGAGEREEEDEKVAKADEEKEEEESQLALGRWSRLMLACARDVSGSCATV